MSVFTNIKIGNSGINNGTSIVSCLETGSFNQKEPQIFDNVTASTINNLSNRYKKYYGRKQGGPLAISSQPQNVSVAVGQTATFDVTVSGGTPGFTYQWEKLEAKST